MSKHPLIYSRSSWQCLSIHRRFEESSILSVRKGFRNAECERKGYVFTACVWAIVS